MLLSLGDDSAKVCTASGTFGRLLEYTIRVKHSFSNGPNLDISGIQTLMSIGYHSHNFFGCTRKVRRDSCFGALLKLRAPAAAEQPAQHEARQDDFGDSFPS